MLKKGGRVSISDIVAIAEIPESIREDMDSRSDCIAGAEYEWDLEDMLKRAGFVNIRLYPKDNSTEIIRSKDDSRGRKNSEDFVASYIIEAEK